MRYSGNTGCMQNTALVTMVLKTLNKTTFLDNSRGLWLLRFGLSSFWTCSSSRIQRKT
jgi:hypothetical protein